MSGDLTGHNNRASRAARADWKHWAAGNSRNTRLNGTAALSLVTTKHWHLTKLRRAVKVRRDQLEAPGRKEFKVYKGLLEQQ